MSGEGLFRQFLVGVGSIVLAPVDALPQPRLVITLPLKLVSFSLTHSIQEAPHRERTGHR